MRFIYCIKKKLNIFKSVYMEYAYDACSALAAAKAGMGSGLKPPRSKNSFIVRGLSLARFLSCCPSS